MSQVIYRVVACATNPVCFKASAYDALLKYTLFQTFPLLNSDKCNIASTETQFNNIGFVGTWALTLILVKKTSPQI